ncbi:hypothetical protein LX77_02670 [Gelidibacter algens]|jgi:hypothetical protein|uniref:Uncharacterized protein n=1 Tax=Gelidibacter algens TaxID=49280 RepID=A0A327S139_9FLAO|nr:hypothetical protein LX77_02670 [Gelidibacter algens]
MSAGCIFRIDFKSDTIMAQSNPGGKPQAKPADKQPAKKAPQAAPKKK